LFDLVREVFLLSESTKSNRTDLTGLQKEFKDFTAKTESEFQHQKTINQQILFELQRLHERLEEMQQREASERRMLQLEVENFLLKASRQLPPKPDEKS
jgi:hypothetical protein